MIRKVEAVIFDMDGVIIDSETIWKRAEREVFTSVGVKLSDELCKITESMTTSEVTKFWFERQPWKDKSLDDVEDEVVERVACLIKQEGAPIDGVELLIKKLKANGYKIGLATNSPLRLIQIVLEKLELTDYFDAVASAEHELEGKPNPLVYQSVAKKLKLKPETCIVVEDSYAGLCAAKDAGMRTILIGKENNLKLEYKIADFKINSYTQFDFSFLN
jgi:sugar-phosphatase